MSLSNTATPKYYGMFRDKVLRGEILVNEEVSMQMNRIDFLIDHPDIYYDDEAVEGFIKFCENELTLTDGSQVRMLDSFKLWGEDLFGWYYFEEHKVYQPGENGKKGEYVTKLVKKRLIHKQYLIVGRGAAKSLYDTFVQAYTLIIDKTTTYQITTAPTMRQSEEVMNPLKTALAQARGPLLKFLTEGSIQNTTGSKANRVKVTATKRGIENFITNSLLEVRPMRIDKLQGLRCKGATVDEWLSCEIKEDPIGAIEQGASKVDDYWILATSSEGTIRNGIGDTMKMELMSILRGEYVNPHVSIWYYRLNNIKDVNNPETWVMANPNIGITVSYETYQLDVERAENAPASRNDILAKRFGIPMEGYTYFFTYEETKIHKTSNYDGMPCSMGIDLSQGDDFCAFTFMFPLGSGYYGVKALSYISQRTFEKLPRATRQKYEEFLIEGSLVVLDGSVLDMMVVYDDLERYIYKHEYDVRSVGFDPYNAIEFVDRWIKENGQYGVEKVIQGARTESVPLGEIKILAEDRMLIFDQLLFSFTMGNCVVLEDTNGNRKLWKKRYAQKIDNVSALMDAYVSYTRNKEAFE